MVVETFMGWSAPNGKGYYDSYYIFW